jgi:hypothetical protein
MCFQGYDISRALQLTIQLRNNMQTIPSWEASSQFPNIL